MLPDAVVAELTRRLPANDVPERPLMQLATVDADGAPDVRSVLLTAWDEDGFLFNTDSASRKVAQLDGRADVALCLVVRGGQVVVRGRATAQTPEEERTAYAARSAYLRQLAWLNTPMLAAVGADERRRAWADFAAANDVAALDPSPTWIGYRVRATRVTLWSPDQSGPSHRVEHALSRGVWTTSELPG